jgi:hypothetical protein
MAAADLLCMLRKKPLTAEVAEKTIVNSSRDMLKGRLFSASFAEFLSLLCG